MQSLRIAESRGKGIVGSVMIRLDSFKVLFRLKFERFKGFKLYLLLLAFDFGISFSVSNFIKKSVRSCLNLSIFAVSSSSSSSSVSSFSMIDFSLNGDLSRVFLDFFGE
mgnify:CR=1 FL=1